MGAEDCAELGAAGRSPDKVDVTEPVALPAAAPTPLAAVLTPFATVPTPFATVPTPFATAPTPLVTAPTPLATAAGAFTVTLPLPACVPDPSLADRSDPFDRELADVALLGLPLPVLAGRPVALADPGEPSCVAVEVPAAADCEGPADADCPGCRRAGSPCQAYPN